MAWSIGKKLSPILEIYFVFKIFTPSEAQIGTIFGAITVASGIVGVLTGAVASNNILKPREGPSADATVCGLSMIISAVFVYLALAFLEVNIHTIKHYHSSLITLFLFLFFFVRTTCCSVGYLFLWESLSYAVAGCLFPKSPSM